MELPFGRIPKKRVIINFGRECKIHFAFDLRSKFILRLTGMHVILRLTGMHVILRLIYVPNSFCV
ncbi:MAG: hypothetical protein DRR16_07210 [Candidatus Parabeggiatoa sp. nov. 3]|nr:MAG: hypothetical protein DRR16_07210 [Gammaproteobacteria bacterium]